MASSAEIRVRIPQPDKEDWGDDAVFVFDGLVDLYEDLEGGKADANHTHGTGGVVFTICTSATRPNPPALGMFISETDTGLTRRCVSISPVTWSSPLAMRSDALYQRRRVPLWLGDGQASAEMIAGSDNPTGLNVLKYPAAGEAWDRFVHDVVVAGADHKVFIQYLMTTAQAVTCNLGVGYRVVPASGAIGSLPLNRWVKSTAYVLGDKVMNTVPNGKYLECTTAGTSHASTEPTCPAVGATVTDNSVVWTVRDGGLKPLGVGATAVPAAAYQGAELTYTIPGAECLAGGKIIFAFFRKADSHGGHLYVLDAEVQAVEA